MKRLTDWQHKELERLALGVFLVTLIGGIAFDRALSDVCRIGFMVALTISYVYLQCRYRSR